MDETNKYHSPELLFELTKIMVGEFGFLKPQNEVTRQSAFYEQRSWPVEKIPESFRRWMQNEFRTPDIQSDYLRCFLAALMDATRNCGAVRFIEEIEDVAVVNNEITIFINSERRDIDKIGNWLFHSTLVDRSKMQPYFDKQIILTNRKPNKV